MKTNIDTYSLCRSIATLAMVLFFPGFFIYHFLVGKGFIPPVLGGYFGYITLILFLPLVVLGGFCLRTRLNGALVLYFLILLLIFLVSIINVLYQEPIGFHKEMFVWSISGVIINIAVLVSSMFFNQIVYAKFSLFFGFIIFFCVVLNIGPFGIFYLKMEAGEVSSQVATYQGFARSILVVFMLALPLLFEKLIRFYVFFLLGIVALYFNGARTEFVLFSFTVLLFLGACSVKSKRTFVALLVVLLLLGSVGLISYSHLPESRMLQLLDLSNSSSYLARLQIHNIALGIIEGNPILGRYGYYAVVGENGLGDFPHNILSAWVNLGLLGFCMYISLFLIMWSEAVVGFFRDFEKHEYKTFLVFLLLTTSSIIVSKDYSYMLISIVVGLYCQYRLKRRVEFVKNCSSHKCSQP